MGPAAFEAMGVSVQPVSPHLPTSPHPEPGSTWKGDEALAVPHRD